jgi:hypothetical protein
MTEPFKIGNRRIVLVTGTDTGVGKTLVTAGLARNLSDRGVRVLAIKPVETGCGGTASEGEDGRILATAARQQAPTEALTRLRAPLAPPVAADLESANLDMGFWRSALHEYAEKSEVVLVEGREVCCLRLLGKNSPGPCLPTRGRRARCRLRQTRNLESYLAHAGSLELLGYPCAWGRIQRAGNARRFDWKESRNTEKFRPGIGAMALPR